MKHTPGPWKYDTTEKHYRRNTIRKNGIPIARVLDIKEGSQFDALWPQPKTTRANGDRIVACINACEGINPEAVPVLLEALERLSSTECFVQPGMISPECRARMKYAEAAIAKARPAEGI